VSELLFFFYFAFFVTRQSRLLERSGRSIRQNTCFWPTVYLLGFSTIFD